MEIHDRISQGIQHGVNRHWRYTKNLLQIKPEYLLTISVADALSEGIATKTHILNTLHRLIDGKAINGPTVDTPQALLLRREPKADVGRYDNLRARSTGGRHAS